MYIYMYTHIHTHTHTHIHTHNTCPIMPPNASSLKFQNGMLTTNSCSTAEIKKISSDAEDFLQPRAVRGRYTCATWWMDVSVCEWIGCGKVYIYHVCHCHTCVWLIGTHMIESCSRAPHSMLIYISIYIYIHISIYSYIYIYISTYMYIYVKILHVMCHQYEWVWWTCWGVNYMGGMRYEEYDCV